MPTVTLRPVMPYLCDVKNKLNSITMKYKSRSIAKVIVPVFLVVSLFAFTTEIALEAIGTVTIGGQERPRNFVVKTMPALKAGENHTIEINF